MSKIIIKLPSVSGGTLFTQEVLAFTGVIVLLAAGILTALIGFRFLEAFLFLMLGMLFGGLGFRIAAGLTSQLEIHLIFFVMFCMVGWVFAEVIVAFLAYLSKKMRFYGLFQRISPYISPVIGALTVSYVMYTCVYDDIAVACLIGILLLTAGLLTGKFRKRERRGFYTYDDLIRLKPLSEKKNA